MVCGLNYATTQNQNEVNNIMAGRFSVEAVFKAVDRITAPVSKMQNRMGKFTRSMNRGLTKVNRNVNKLAGGIKRAGLAIVASMAIAGGAMANVIGAGADFEQAITNVGAVTLQTRDQIQPLEKLALELGRTTKFTATQAADAMEIMARAGFEVNDILSATPGVLAAAAASGLEIAEVANVVSNALKGMGLEATEAGRVADILALASSKTNSSIGSLGESLKNVASTAKQLNIPLTDTVASIALLQDVGLDASVAGSAFNVMLTKMAAPTAGITKKMKKFGITFKDSAGNMLPLQKVLQQLNVASKQAGGNFDKVAFLAELVGLRGQKAAANLGDLFEAGKLDTLIKQLENAAGSAEKMADIRMNTFQGSLLLLGSAIDAVKVKAFNLQSGPLKDVVDRMTKWVSVNEDLIATNIGQFLGKLLDNLPVIVDWIKKIGKGLIVFFSFMVLLKTFITIMTAVNLVMALNPIGLIVIGVVALIAGLTALGVWVFNITDGFKGWGDVILKLLNPLQLLIDGIKFVRDNGIGGTFSKVGSFLGFGNDDEPGSKSATIEPQVISPQERIARSIEENKTTAEVTIKTEPGTNAQVTGGKFGGGLQLLETGAF